MLPTQMGGWVAGAKARTGAPGTVSRSHPAPFVPAWAPRLLPGLALCAVLAAVATLVQEVAAALGADVVSAVFVAILLGVAWRSAVGLPAALQPGISFAAKRVLKGAIVLLGLRFSLGAVAETGLSALVVILAVVVVAFASVWLLGRLLHLSPRLALLIGVGTAICGNSAIAAAAPIIDADEEEVAFASATITLFGTVAIVAYPLLAVAVGLTAQQFGVIAGAAVQDSAQAVASGFIFSQAAGEVATVVKLTRTAFLVPLLLVLALLPLERSGTRNTRRGDLRAAFPWFALGFLVLSAVRTLGDVVFAGVRGWEAFLDAAQWTATFLLVVAMAGIGLSTSFTRLRAIGLRPFYAGLAAALTVAVTALGVVLLGGTRA
jgi:uncharacterized integral membrane protein (TIGR00698 family)